MHGEDVFGNKISVSLVQTTKPFSNGGNKRKATLDKLGALRYSKNKNGKQKNVPQCKQGEHEGSPSSDRFSSPEHKSGSSAGNGSPNINGSSGSPPAVVEVADGTPRGGARKKGRKTGTRNRRKRSNPSLTVNDIVNVHVPVEEPVLGIQTVHVLLYK